MVIFKLSLIMAALIIIGQCYPTTVSEDGQPEVADEKVINVEIEGSDDTDEFNNIIVEKKTNDLREDPKFSKYVDNVKFKLWTTSKNNDYHSTYVETTLNNEFVLKEVWQKDVPLKVIIHGWLIETDESELLVFTVKKAYTDETNKYNVITVNWGEFTKTVNYFKTASRYDKVGIIIGHFLINLYKLEIETPNNMHLIGHSLGAHVAGIGGRTFSKMTNERIARITGLDPSRLLFESAWFICGKFYEQLNSDDAEFVDVIYTSKGLLGMSTDIGHANFYPNNGKCSHARSYVYYSESVSQVGSFQSVECSSINNFNKGRCQDNKISYMGHNALPSAHGNFYLMTNKMYPFSLPLPKWSRLYD